MVQPNSLQLHVSCVTILIHYGSYLLCWAWFNIPQPSLFDVWEIGI